MSQSAIRDISNRIKLASTSVGRADFVSQTVCSTPTSAPQHGICNATYALRRRRHPRRSLLYHRPYRLAAHPHSARSVWHAAQGRGGDRRCAWHRARDRGRVRGGRRGRVWRRPRPARQRRVDRVCSVGRRASGAACRRGGRRRGAAAGRDRGARAHGLRAGRRDAAAGDVGSVRANRGEGGPLGCVCRECGHPAWRGGIGVPGRGVEQAVGGQCEWRAVCRAGGGAPDGDTRYQGQYHTNCEYEWKHYQPGNALGSLQHEQGRRHPARALHRVRTRIQGHSLQHNQPGIHIHRHDQTLPRREPRAGGDVVQAEPARPPREPGRAPWRRAVLRHRRELILHWERPYCRWRTNGVVAAGYLLCSDPSLCKI